MNVTWTRYAPMATPRAFPVLTSLADGGCLVTSGAFAAETTHPEDRRWRPAGTLDYGLVRARTERAALIEAMVAAPFTYELSGLTATRLLDCTVLVVGGSSSWRRPAPPPSLADRLRALLSKRPAAWQPPEPMQECRRWDPAQRAFLPTGPLGLARELHRAVRLADGRVLVTGGCLRHVDGNARRIATPSCELYDPATGRFTPAAPLAEARSFHTLTLLCDGRVLATGGHAARPLSSCELYDPASNRWSHAPSLPTARHAHAASLLPDGRVVVSGGYLHRGTSARIEAWSPIDGSWSPLARSEVARGGHLQAPMGDGRLLLAGGSCETPDDDDTVSRLTASAELLDCSTGRLTPVDPLPEAIEGIAWAPLGSGEGLVTGFTRDEPARFPVFRWGPATPA